MIIIRVDVRLHDVMVKMVASMGGGDVLLAAYDDVTRFYNKLGYKPIGLNLMICQGISPTNSLQLMKVRVPY